MKRALNSHKQLYLNQKSYLGRLESELNRAQAAYDKTSTDLALYKAQIELAEKEGKDSFDSERYAIKRLCV